VSGADRWAATVPSDPAILVAAGALLVGVLVLALALLGARARRLAAQLADRDDERSLLVLQQEIDGLREQVARAIQISARGVNDQLAQMSATVDRRLHQGVELTQQAHRVLGDRLDNTARVVGAVERSLGGLEEANRRMLEIGRDIASLQEILRPPKPRGGLGEALLEDLLRQVLPAEHLAFQYAFASGQRVDAVIRLEAGMVPVDAKFPLDNFRRMLAAEDEREAARARRAFVADVRRHVDAIAERYIRPDEGTLDFALMYVPAENVYYEMIVRDELRTGTGVGEYALRRKVIAVSPGSFYAYLQAIAHGLRGLRIERRASEIMDQLTAVRDACARLREAHRVVGRHLANAAAGAGQTERRLAELEARLARLAGEEPPDGGSEPTAVEA